MKKNCAGRATKSELKAMLERVNNEKAMCKKIIITTCREMWIQVMNILSYQYIDNNQRRHVKQFGEIKVAIWAIEEEKDRYAFVYFLFNFVRSPLYIDALGITHQQATVNIIECVLNITFERKQDQHQHDKPISTEKTCIHGLYGQIYNEIKQNMLKSILPKHITISCEHQLVPKTKHWKRDPYQYYIHTSADNTTNQPKPHAKYIKSEEVSVYYTACTQNEFVTDTCCSTICETAA